MILVLAIFFTVTFSIESAKGQEGSAPSLSQINSPSSNAPALPPTNLKSPNSAAAAINEPEQQNSEIAMKEKIFSYDGNEGRDPFKIYRENPIFPDPNSVDLKGNSTTDLSYLEKNIRTAIVPSEVSLMGILYKKVDPIALIAVKGVKGLNQVKINSPIGRNEGKVIDIQKDRIVIEQVRDFDGQKFTEKVVLKVREKKTERN